MLKTLHEEGLHEEGLHEEGLHENDCEIIENKFLKFEFLSFIDSLRMMTSLKNVSGVISSIKMAFMLKMMIVMMIALKMIFIFISFAPLQAKDFLKIDGADPTSYDVYISDCYFMSKSNANFPTTTKFKLTFRNNETIIMTNYIDKNNIGCNLSFGRPVNANYINFDLRNHDSGATAKFQTTSEHQIGTISLPDTSNDNLRIYFYSIGYGPTGWTTSYDWDLSVWNNFFTNWDSVNYGSTSIPNAHLVILGGGTTNSSINTSGEYKDNITFTPLYIFQISAPLDNYINPKNFDLNCDVSGITVTASVDITCLSQPTTTLNIPFSITSSTGTNNQQTVAITGTGI